MSEMADTPRQPRYCVQHLQDLHYDQRDIAGLPLLPDVSSHFIDNAPAHFSGRSSSHAAESIEQAVFSEVLLAIVSRLRDASLKMSNQSPEASSTLPCSAGKSGSMPPSAVSHGLRCPLSPSAFGSSRSRN
jgi:hypothetical protein